MQHQARIESLVIENFQSLRERAEIPMRALTFLYGPNSAGKSSVYDALTFIDTILTGSRRSLMECVTRWQHISSVDEKPHPIKVETHFFAIGILTGDSFFGGEELRLPDEIISSSGDGLFSFMKEGPGRIDILIEASKRDLPLEFNDEIMTLSVQANGLPLLNISSYIDPDDGYGGSMVKLFPKVFGSTLSALAERHGLDPEYLDSPDAYSASCRLQHEPLSLSPEIDEDGFNEFNRDILAIANYILEELTHLYFTPKIVIADRQVIQDENLSVICSCEYDLSYPRTSNEPFRSQLGLPSAFVQAPVGAIERLGSLSTSVISGLAESRLQEGMYLRAVELVRGKLALLDISDDLKIALAGATDTGSLMTPDQVQIPQTEALHDFVNRCLSDHLFLDQGYQIAFDLCELLPPQKNIRQGLPQLIVSPYTGSLIFQSAALIVCSLLDKAGRRVTFKDVGTGISCVLPVLVALHSWSSFIEQPELHLHPALQSAIGDIFVEAAHVEHALHLIETHSEYVLLRCLRRIRETTSGKHTADSPLALTPNDVSVLYFDPQPDGSTRVKKLRVSSQGDFIDRWPRGFFEERGKELFDE